MYTNQSSKLLEKCLYAVKLKRFLNKKQNTVLYSQVNNHKWTEMLPPGKTRSAAHIQQKRMNLKCYPK